jgi:hypothetical protein
LRPDGPNAWQTRLASMDNFYLVGRRSKNSTFFVRHAFAITIQNGGIVTDGEELEAKKTRQTNAVFFFFCLHSINCYLSPFYSSVCCVRFLVGWSAGMFFSSSLKEAMISENDGRSFGSLHRTKLQQN